MNPYQFMPFKVWAIAYLLNALWQLPLITLAALVTARIARSAGPRVEHRSWVAALFAQILLPACQFDFSAISSLLHKAFSQLGLLHPVATGQILVKVSAPQTASPGLHLSANLLLAISFTYLAAFFFFAARLVWGLVATHRLARQAQPLSAAEQLRPRLSRYSKHFNLDSHPAIHLGSSARISSPVTFGLFRQHLIFPPQFLEAVEPSDLDAVLAHECAHIRRRDYAKNIFYELLSLPIAFHPALWLTRARLAETREMACDELAADAVHGREQYAHALLRLATSLADHIANEAPARTIHAIGIFDANIFERRIMHLTQKPTQLKTSRRYAIAAAAFVVACATCASALAFHVAISPAAIQAANPKSIHVKSDDMKIVSQVRPVYPELAKHAKVEGSEVLAAVISKDGNAESLRVISGPKELQGSALDAVRQWKWEPYHLNGEPIEVKTDVTVVYSLAK